MAQNKEILLGLTTTYNSNWQDKIQEIKKLNIKRIALFPTVLKIDQRKQLYNSLENSPIEEIPHVHLRDDMEDWEMELFEKKYGTQYYNIHESSLKNQIFEKYRHKIYIENLSHSLNENNLSRYAGLCLDFSRLEKSYRKNIKVYRNIIELAKKFAVGCCHVSARKKFLYTLHRLIKKCGSHFLMDLSELDYVSKYSQFLPNYISIELENSFTEQLKAKEYLEKIINGKK